MKIGITKCILTVEPATEASPPPQSHARVGEAPALPPASLSAKTAEQSTKEDSK